MHSLVNNHILQFVYLVYLVLYLGLLFPSLLCERLFLEVPYYTCLFNPKTEPTSK